MVKRSWLNSKRCDLYNRKTKQIKKKIKKKVQQYKIRKISQRLKNKK